MTEALITLFLCGDVMTGRGIDQVLPNPSDPEIHEAYVHDARRYLALAEEESGDIDTPLRFEEVWGEGLDVLEQTAPDAHIINLETAVTTSDDHWPGKGIHYRMHPDNIGVLTAADIDCASLANNHALDWGRAGLAETIETLDTAGIETAGAGTDEDAASAPGIVEIDDGRRVLVFAFATPDSGVPPAWAAAGERPGISVLPTLGAETAERVAGAIDRRARDDDIVVVSIHWGGNWGYEIPDAQIDFAHRLVDDAGVDVVHGHSSHHAKGIEIYNDRLILYGCGDLITDYEGIGGHEQYRPDLSLMYLPTVDEQGRLTDLALAPMRMHRFRLRRAGDEDRAWLRDMLNRESERFGIRVRARDDGMLGVEWNAEAEDGSSGEKESP